jgi:hypothetical protein
MFLLSPLELAEAKQRNTQPVVPVEFKGEVRLQELTWFALTRDPETGYQGLQKVGEPLFSGRDPLPIGKLVTVREDSLVIVLPGGTTMRIAKGKRLPGPRVLLFVQGLQLDVLRFEVRYGGGPASPGAEYSVIRVVGRQAVLQRDALAGEGQSTAPGSAGSGRPLGRPEAPAPGGPSSPPKDSNLANLVNRLPLSEVAPDTWELPARDAREIGGQVGGLLTEALASAKPSLTLWYGVALSLETSLGAGTLDRRGFLIDNIKLAQRTGLELGDRILFVNEQPVNTFGGLYRIYKTLTSDSGVSEVKVVVNRDSQVRALTYRLR